MIKKESLDRQDRVRVTFILPSNVWAERVNLVGEFNNWNTTATPMRRNRSDANWHATIELPVGHAYRFRYLIDGKEWLNDWHADDHMENPYGSFDSVVDLTGSGSAPEEDDAAIDDDAATDDDVAADDATAEPADS
jgi:1,4-alpha-glucan branching enzyme